MQSTARAMRSRIATSSFTPTQYTNRAGLSLGRTRAQSPQAPQAPLAAPAAQRRWFQNMLAPAEGTEGADTPLAINKLTPRGWVLSDDLLIPGGAIIHSGRAILWDVDPPVTENTTGGFEGMWSGWSKERFRAFEVLVPRPEILLFGTGQRAIPAPKAIREYISSLGIQLDVMDSRNAASTYNLLAEEGRTVAAALCPLGPIEPRTGSPR